MWDKEHWLKSWLQYLAVCALSYYKKGISLNFLTCKIRIIMIPTKDCREGEIEFNKICDTQEAFNNL